MEHATTAALKKANPPLVSWALDTLSQYANYIKMEKTPHEQYRTAMFDYSLTVRAGGLVPSAKKDIHEAFNILLTYVSGFDRYDHVKGMVDIRDMPNGDIQVATKEPCHTARTHNLPKHHPVGYIGNFMANNDVNFAGSKEFLLETTIGAP